MNGLKAENWKYSPVQLLPEGYEIGQAASNFTVKSGEQRELVTHHDASSLFKNSILEITVGENASLHHSHLFNEGPTGMHVEQIRVVIGRNGRYVLNSLTIASKWSRCDIHVSLKDEGAECHLFGLDLAKSANHVDRHLLVEHLAPHTTSSQLFKGIFDEQASSSFFGKIWVHHGADGTSAKQVNRNLLLSPNATAYTRPQLEIDTDDVACTHGATVGQLDDNAVFFMRSRGLSEDVARSMLTEAFAREVIEAFKVGAEREDMERKVLSWLQKEQR